MRPIGPASQYSESYVGLPISSFVSTLRPVERAVIPSSPNGLLSQYQRILLIFSEVRLTRNSAIAFAPIMPILFLVRISLCRFRSFIASTVISAFPIWQLSELFEFATKGQALQLQQIANNYSSHRHLA
jgi:hypothetical protein